MGRELQKKKKRSSIPKIKLKPKSKRVNPLGNPIIAANWNQSETLTQNYRRLGLTSRLNAATGGIEKSLSKSNTSRKLAIANTIPTEIAPTEARVERDPKTGKILRVIHADRKIARENPLNDPLLTDDEDEGEDGEGFEGFEGDREGNEIVRRLEDQAQNGGKKVRERKQSQREREWIERLVGRYGDDVGKMVRDRKMNPMQQTERDIERRIKQWRKGGGSTEEFAV